MEQIVTRSLWQFSFITESSTGCQSMNQVGISSPENLAQGLAGFEKIPCRCRSHFTPPTTDKLLYKRYCVKKWTFQTYFVVSYEWCLLLSYEIVDGFTFSHILVRHHQGAQGPLSQTPREIFSSKPNRLRPIHRHHNKPVYSIKTTTNPLLSCASRDECVHTTCAVSELLTAPGPF